ncbi:tetratricopeptide repeat protein [Thermodesulfobacteriota bacterium]
MKKSILWILVCSFIFVVPAISMASDYLTEADEYFSKGKIEDYKKAIELYLEALKKNPESYEINWKLARAYRWYGEESKRQGIDGWKEICAKYGKIGMKYGEKAISLNPDGVEGHYFYGLNVGIYSDGVSIVTALREGLKGKTQSSFEKAYELDKTYNTSGPTVALGRFWFVLPWPLNDKKKAHKYLREANKAEPDNIDGRLYLGELLMDLGGKRNKAEARALLESVAESDIKYYRDKASALLSEMD